MQNKREIKSVTSNEYLIASSEASASYNQVLRLRKERDAAKVELKTAQEDLQSKTKLGHVITDAEQKEVAQKKQALVASQQGLRAKLEQRKQRLTMV